jgi:16S rRNA processing protein RimM
MTAENYQHIGKITKLHGFQGEVVLLAENGFDKNFHKTELVFLLIDGLPVPFFISRLQIKSTQSAIIKFDDIDTAEEIEDLLGTQVLIPKKKGKKSQSTIGINDIKGYKVIDLKKGEVGTAETVLNYQANYLLQVFRDKKEILIPVTEEIVKEIDDKNKCIFIDAPEGLLELYY